MSFKGTMVVISTSVIIIILFFVFGYLLLNVNPDPLVSNPDAKKPDTRDPDGKVLDIEGPDDKGDEIGPDSRSGYNPRAKESSDLVYLTDDFFSKLKRGPLRYGFESAEDITNTSDYIDREAVNDTETLPTKISVSTNATSEVNKIEHSNIAIPILKKAKRRSTNENADLKLEQQIGAFIMKLVSETGHANIEINAADGSIENKVNNDSLTNSVEDTKLNKQEDRSKVTKLKLLPNNSFIFDQSPLTVSGNENDTNPKHTSLVI